MTAAARTLHAVLRSIRLTSIDGVLTMANSRKPILVVGNDRSPTRMVHLAASGGCELVYCESLEQALQMHLEQSGELVLIHSPDSADDCRTCCRLKAAATARGLAAEVFCLAAPAHAPSCRRPAEAEEVILRPAVRSDVPDPTERPAVRPDAPDGRTRADGADDWRRPIDLLAVQDAAIVTLATVAEFSEEDRGAHLERIREYSRILAEQLRRDGPYASIIDREFVDDLYRSSILHDIGKCCVMASILRNKRRSCAETSQLLQRHTVIGAYILERGASQGPAGGFLAMAAVIARYHHERFDGTGYLAGLAGDEIPLPARIVALADRYEDLTCPSGENRPRCPAEAKGIIEQDAGKAFDPVIVDAFRARFEEFLLVQKRHVDWPMAIGALAVAGEKDAAREPVR